MSSALEGFRDGLNDFFNLKTDIVEHNKFGLQELLTRQNISRLLEEMVDNDEILQQIAQRSYIHSQGFRKIILIDDRSVLGYKLRLHTWPINQAQQDAPPLTEMKHKHRWNFGGVILKGSTEDHWYTIKTLNATEQEIYERFENAMERIAPDRVQEICDRIDALEASELPDESKLVRLNGDKDSLIKKANVPELVHLLELTRTELDIVTRILAKYTNERPPGITEEIYRSAGPRIFTPASLQTHHQDEFRIHPIDMAHRLVIDPSEYVATAIVTGPIHTGEEPGEFVRTRRGKAENEARHRRYFDIESLRQEIREVIRHLSC